MSFVNAWTPRTLRRCWLGLLGAYLLGFASGNARAAQDRAIAFTHVMVIDGTGSEPNLEQTVVVSGDRIAALGDASELSIPEGARVIDGTGKVLIPGLWDMHVHTRYEGIDHLRLFIGNGITSVRDMAAPWEHFETIKEWRNEISKGARVGPSIPIFKRIATSCRMSYRFEKHAR